MDWVMGFMERAVFWGSLAGGAALVGGGAFVARAVHLDAGVLASSVSDIIMRENKHRARLVRLMEAAESRAAPVIATLLEDVRVALANRVDCESVGRDLVAATRALKAAGADSADASAARMRVGALWAALITNALTQVLAGVYLGTFSRAAVRICLAIRAAEEGRALTAAARNLHRASIPAPTQRTRQAVATAGEWDPALGAAVTEALFGRVHSWVVGEGTNRVVDACREAVREAFAEAGGAWGTLVGCSSAHATPTDAAPHASPVSLSALRTVLRRATFILSGKGAAGMAVTRSWLPRAAECTQVAGPGGANSDQRRQSLMDESLTPRRRQGAGRVPTAPTGDASSPAADAEAGGGVDRASGAHETALSRVPSAVAFGAESISDRLLLVVWDVLDSPQFELAAAPALAAAHHRLRPALRAAAEAAQASDSAAGLSAGSARAGSDPEARLGIFARKLISDVDSVAAAAAAGQTGPKRAAAAAPGGGEGAGASDAILVCLARRVFAELTGAHEAATAGVAGGEAGSDEAALNALLARVLAETSQAHAVGTAEATTT